MHPVLFASIPLINRRDVGYLLSSGLMLTQTSSFQVLALLFLKWFRFLFRVERPKPVPVLLLGLRVFDSFLWC